MDVHTDGQFQLDPSKGSLVIAGGKHDRQMERETDRWTDKQDHVRMKTYMPPAR